MIVHEASQHRQGVSAGVLGRVKAPSLFEPAYLALTRPAPSRCSALADAVSCLATFRGGTRARIPS